MTMDATETLELNAMHIYASAWQHQEAWIIGNRRALTELRDALTEVLRGDKPCSVHAFANDGEGFATIVSLIDPERFQQLVLPYTDSESQGLKSTGNHPYTSVSPEEYRRLAKP